MTESTEKNLSQREKGEETRRKNWEKRMEKKRLAEKARAEAEKKRRQQDERFMSQALTQAKKAAALGDVPIGCVIVHE